MRLVKLLLAAALTVGLLAGCGSTTASPQPVKTQVQQSDDDDFVLFRNADGSDCDFDDLLEGDSDCYGYSSDGKKHKVTKNYASTHKSYIQSHQSSKVQNSTVAPTKPKQSSPTTKTPTVKKETVKKTPPKTVQKKGTITKRNTTKKSSSSSKKR